MSILYELMSKFSATIIVIPASGFFFFVVILLLLCFGRIAKLIKEFIRKFKRLRMAKIIFFKNVFL
jgi:hypothetical protein